MPLLLDRATDCRGRELIENGRGIDSIATTGFVLVALERTGERHRGSLRADGHIGQCVPAGAGHTRAQELAMLADSQSLGSRAVFHTAA